MIKILLLLILFTSSSFAVAIDAFSHVTLKIKEKTLQIEYADTDTLRNLGLMHRKSLCTDCGMFFKLDQAYRVGMWMKNTHIALDVAFIRSDGLIIGIEVMRPLDLTIVDASEAVLYVLEMNQGWFLANDIVVGDKVFID